MVGMMGPILDACVWLAAAYFMQVSSRNCSFDSLNQTEFELQSADCGSARATLIEGSGLFVECVAPTIGPSVWAFAGIWATATLDPKNALEVYGEVTDSVALNARGGNVWFSLWSNESFDPLLDGGIMWENATDQYFFVQLEDSLGQHPVNGTRRVVPGNATAQWFASWEQNKRSIEGFMAGHSVSMSTKAADNGFVQPSVYGDIWNSRGFSFIVVELSWIVDGVRGGMDWSRMKC